MLEVAQACHTSSEAVEPLYFAWGHRCQTAAVERLVCFGTSCGVHQPDAEVYAHGLDHLSSASLRFRSVPEPWHLMYLQGS
jgi:hypothetical protein